MATRDSDNTQHLRLHYKTPAAEWSSALPIGNGRLGAVVYGRTSTEMFQLNEDSVWYGGPQERTPQDAHRHLPLLQQLIREENHEAVHALVREAFFAAPASMRHYEPLGNCTLEFNHQEDNVTDYSRHLDLSSSQATVEYRHKGVSYRRDVIASKPDDVLAVRISASAPTRFVIRLDRVSEHETETNSYLDEVYMPAGKPRIILHATPGGRQSNRLCIVLRVSCDDESDEARIERGNGCLIVTTKSCTIAIAGQTTYRHTDPEAAALADVDQALGRSWNELVQRHREDYARLFNRMSLRMWPDACHIPTNERILTSRDPGLVALYHNYGRYLLISSSRKGHKALPATLQGIWSSTFAPPWGSKFTININLQMNYWPVARCGLLDSCLPPVTELLERMASRGRETAQAMYGCRGWCAHHNTDIWGDTSPQDRWLPATLWPLGGVWLTIDVVDTLRFQYDQATHHRLLPILEGCVEFVLDFLVPSGDYLVTNPSLSPENTFVSKSGAKGVFCQGSVLDITIVRVVFEQFVWSTEVLNLKDHRLRKRVGEALEKLPPIRVNKEGLIQEWGLEDFEEAEPGHRHVSHLFGLYPADIISPVRSPTLADAAGRVLRKRAQHGGGHTGWSRAWLLNLHARLFDSVGCNEHVDLLLRSSTLPNMLDTHPPFQIDGNFGGCAGILECLVQSIEMPSTKDVEGKVVEIRLLPSCPSNWSAGSLVGARMRQGWTTSFRWENGEILEPVDVHNTQANSPSACIIFPSGERIVVKPSLPGQTRKIRRRIGK